MLLNRLGQNHGTRPLLFSVIYAVFFWALNVPVANATLPLTQPPDNSNLATTEVWRIRIDNSEDGPIDISLDKGATWSMIGRVSDPATESLEGYLAAGYAPIGAVAATAVHGIRIRLGDTQNAYPNLINIVPREFASTPVFFGGHIAGASGIYTNIPSGVSLFREFAPYVGSLCYVTDPGTGALTQLGTSYSPKPGDVLIIIVKRRVNELRNVIFPNKAGEPVIAAFADGTVQTVTHVAKAVTGVGRFDGTSYTGVGAVNTNHTCVVTISTAPVTTSTLLEGVGDERRGGFQIEPYYHNTQTDEVGAPQVLVLGTPHSQTPELEGREPLYYGSIDLAWDPNDLVHSWVCDVETVSTGDAWVPMPQMVGDDDTIIQRKGIIAFRLHRDSGDDPGWLQSRLTLDTASYQDMRLKQAQNGDLPLITGNYIGETQIPPDDLKKGATTVEYSINGRDIWITNNAPYLLQWDSRSTANGEYLLRADIETTDGKVIDSVLKCVVVKNGS